jgi:hypothetical protein
VVSRCCPVNKVEAVVSIGNDNRLQAVERAGKGGLSNEPQQVVKQVSDLASRPAVATLIGRDEKGSSKRSEMGAAVIFGSRLIIGEMSDRLELGDLLPG